MRVWVRRRLHDEGADPRYSESDIDSALVVGAQQVQAAIEEINPEAFEREYRANLQIGKSAYQLPRGYLRTKTLLLDLNGDGNYETEVDKTRMWRIRKPSGRLALAQQGGVYYAVSGGVLNLSYQPTAEVEDGLQLWYVPSLEMADDDDDLEASGLYAPFHIAVILWGVKLLMPEESESQRDIDAEITKVMDRAATLYAGADDADEQLEVEGIGLELAQ